MQSWSNSKYKIFAKLWNLGVVRYAHRSQNREINVSQKCHAISYLPCIGPYPDSTQIRLKNEKKRTWLNWNTRNFLLKLQSRNDNTKMCCKKFWKMFKTHLHVPHDGIISVCSPISQWVCKKFVTVIQLKGRGQERPLDFSLESNMAKTAPNLACQFVYTCRKLPCTCFPRFCCVFQK